MSQNVCTADHNIPSLHSLALPCPHLYFIFLAYTTFSCTFSKFSYYTCPNINAIQLASPPRRVIFDVRSIKKKSWSMLAFKIRQVFRNKCRTACLLEYMPSINTTADERHELPSTLGDELQLFIMQIKTLPRHTCHIQLTQNSA